MPSNLSPVIELKTAHQIVFSPGCDRVAFCDDRAVTVLDTMTRQQIFKAKPCAHPSDLDFAPDGQRLVVKSTSGRTVLLDANTGRTIQNIANADEGEGGPVLFSACGDYLISVSWNGLLTVRDCLNAKLVYSQAYTGMLDHLCAPINRRLFVYSISEPAPSSSEAPPPQRVFVRAWPLQSEGIEETSRCWSFIGALQVSPSGRWLAIVYGGSAKVLVIYDLEREAEVAQQPVKMGGTGYSIGWSHDEALVALNGDHCCSLYSRPELRLHCELPLRYPCHVGFSTDSRWAAFGSWRKSFLVPCEHLNTFVEQERAAGKAKGLQ